MALKIRVRNFQSLEDVALDIDGFTVVTGANNTGKSALMRAIRAAFQNLRGTSFIRHGANKTIVDVEFSDGHKLTWEKGRKRGDKPTYYVGDGGAIHPGQGVPDKVRDSGVRPITAGNREVWPQIAPQFTGQVFLLDQPGSVMAEAVADVERVGQLNQSLRMASSDKRQASSELAIRREDEVQTQKNLEKFDGLDDVDDVVQKVEETYQLCVQLDNALDVIRGLRDRRQEALDDVSFLSNIKDVTVPEIDETRSLQEEYKVSVMLRDRLACAKDRVEVLVGIKEVDSDVDMSGAQERLKALQTTQILHNKLSRANTQVTALGDELERAETSEAHMSQELFDALGGLDRCPVCGQLMEDVPHD